MTRPMAHRSLGDARGVDIAGSSERSWEPSPSSPAVVGPDAVVGRPDWSTPGASGKKRGRTQRYRDSIAFAISTTA